MRVLDLCSGSGGFSEAFVLAGDDVIRVDINPKFNVVPHTITADAMTYEPPWTPEVVLAGPPCQAFSRARYGYEKKHGRHPDYDFFLRLARHCIDSMNRWPDALVFVENPMGRLRHEIGMPTETFDQCYYGRTSRKRTDLWGNYTAFGTLAHSCPHATPHVGHVPAYSEKPNSGMRGRWGRSALIYETPTQRAHLPLSFSEAVRAICLRKWGASA